MRELAYINENLSGLDATLGLRYTGVGPDAVRSELHVTAAHLQPAGLVNGGVYASMAESAGSLGGMVLAPTHTVVGINNSTDFLKSVRAGVIVCEARPIHAGRRTQLWQILMTHRDDVVARSTLRTMVMVPSGPTPQRDR